MSKLWVGFCVVVAACRYPALPDSNPGSGGEIDASTATDASTAIDAATDGAAVAPPRVDVTVNRPAVSTELKTTNLIDVTVTGSDGFSGNVALTAVVVDASGAQIPGWTASLDQPSVTLAVNGTATASVTLTIPPLRSSLTGTVKVTGTSTATVGNRQATSAITVADQVTWNIAVVGGTCAYPPDAGTTANPVTIAFNTKVRFFNSGNTDFVIHGSGIIQHQSPTMPTTAGTAYVQTPSMTGSAIWYCHSPGTDLGAGDPMFVVQ